MITTVQAQPPVAVSTGREVRVALEAREVPWEVAPGRTVRAWAYNGQVPGPVIEAAAGDTLVVTLTNRLAEATTIHWHGIRLPAAMDGTEMTQRLIEPGETFEYRFVLPDAGLFWYHPHANEAVQMERGLYGALLVHGPDEPVADRERVLMLDDMRLTRDGEFRKFGGLVERHNGREGDVRLVNGRQEPSLAMAAGQVERWRIVNASSARYVRLGVGGRSFTLIGTDGGLLERPHVVGDVLLAPGDRADIMVGPFVEGEQIAVEALPFNRGVNRTKRPQRFATAVVGSAEPTRASMPRRLRVIDPLATRGTAVTREVHLGGRLSLRRGVDFMINGQPHHHDHHPVTVGELQVWDVFNDTPIDHPFHLHGFFFQVLDINGEPPAFRSWEDVVTVPRKGRVRIAWLPDDRPGMWMYHCHILEHVAAGMMAHFEVRR